MALSVLVFLFMSLCVSLSLSLFLCICLSLSVSPLPDTYFPLESDGFQFLVNISFVWGVMWSFWVGYIFLLRLLASWLNFLRKLFSSHRTSHWGPSVWVRSGWHGECLPLLPGVCSVLQGPTWAPDLVRLFWAGMNVAAFLSTETSS